MCKKDSKFIVKKINVTEKLEYSLVSNTKSNSVKQKDMDKYIKEIKTKLLNETIPESDFLGISNMLLINKDENKEVQAFIVLMITKAKNMDVVKDLLYIDGFNHMIFYTNIEENSDSVTYYYDIEDSMSETIDIPVDLITFIRSYIKEIDYYLDLEETYYNIQEARNEIIDKWHSNEIKYSNKTSIHFDCDEYEDEYWVDKNNNKWLILDFTEEEAFNNSKTLINCAYCKNCYNCIGSSLLYECSECINCVDCKHSKGCINCENKIN